MAVDDCLRVAFVQAHRDERGATTARFLADAAAFFTHHGVALVEVMTDRAFAYTQAHAFQHVLGHLGARHRATRPYRPQTNGKTKRFIKTLLDEWWAYARLYRFNAARLETLPDWLATYNYHRAHTALAGQTPMWVLVNKAGGNHS